MSIKVKASWDKEQAMLREAYVESIMALAEKDERVCALDADLASSIGMKTFYKAYPGRAFNCGIMEANMMGVAAGLSATGKIPFAHTFGVFATRRACDQVFMSCAYAKLNVRIIGSDPGVTAAYNGGTHMPFEDMATLRCIPEITLLEPADSVALKAIMAQLLDVYGVYYMRLARKNVPGVYEDGSEFKIGKGNVLRDGNDLTIISSGILVAESLIAAKKLEGEGISARVVDMFTWKPLDGELVAESAAKTGAIVTAENHNTLCGLGSAVCEVVCETCPVPVERIGTHDQFGEVGTEDYLKKRFYMTADDICAAAKKALARKK